MDLVTSTALRALCSDTCWRYTPGPIDTLLQFKTNKNIFRNEKCKVIFGVEYTKICLCVAEYAPVNTFGSGTSPCQWPPFYVDLYPTLGCHDMRN